ncbi:unnamed protein product [Euphydryas editha]|uniref:Nucleoporin NUP42 n=1 Tax=Euphydryas editha TaxID=104508 RepID=A0AAU9TY30_EUPED|nr:unnamed protein product [Euphydryas editha]
MVVCKFFQQGYCRYGQSCRFEHMYGQKYSYRAPQTQNESSSNVASSLFRSAAQNVTVFNSAPNNSTFQQKPQTRASVFDRLGPVQNSAGFQNNQAQSIFAQANQSVFGQPSPPRNAFQTQSDAAKSIFAQATQNIFGPAQSGNFFQRKDNAANLFATAAQSLPKDQFNLQNSSPFTQQTPQNIFQISDKQTSNLFGVTANVFDQSSNDEDVYSKVEDLSKSDLDAFESLEFKLGFIPELPPPKSLCV